jgi:hypothetical protein
VNSGFGDGGSWDDELESVSAGWQFELRGLKHYLERHKDRDRHHTATHVVTALPLDEVWKRLLSPAAFTITDGTLVEGGRVVIRAATGDQLSGTVAWHNPGHDLFVTVDEFDQGVFRLCTWRAGGQTGVQIWLVSYAPTDATRVRDFGVRTKALVERLFQPFPRGFAPRTPRHALSRAASPARSDRVARSPRSLALIRPPSILCDGF